VNPDADYLKHIRDAIDKIDTYVAVGQERFFSESHWQDAVIRQLEIIGEATKRLSPPLRRQHPEVAWRRMAGMRDVLIHNYMGIDIGVVWQVTQRDLPELKQQLKAILNEESQE
jgi:uncharacterized protein with HEPN domain